MKNGNCCMHWYDLEEEKVIYESIIKTHIKNNIFLSASNVNLDVGDIRVNVKPTFQYLNIDTWIIKGDGGYQIIWESPDNFNVGWIDRFLQEFKFRRYPDFKGGTSNVFV